MLPYIDVRSTKFTKNMHACAFINTRRSDLTFINKTGLAPLLLMVKVLKKVFFKISGEWCNGF